MDSIIENGLKNSMSYQEYRELVKQMTEENTSTGHEKTKEMARYTMLNNSRMKRWDKTIKVPNDIEKKLKSFQEQVTWLVIVESWCGDGAHILPALNKLAELNRYIELKVVLRDDNPDLMNAFLTDGARAIPKLIMIDQKSERVLDTYGPRPSEAAAYVNRFKAKYGTLTPEFKEDLQHWYNTNKGLNVMEDIVEALGNLEPNFCQ